MGRRSSPPTSQRRVLGGAGGGAKHAARATAASILFTASTNALVGYRYYADYNATKAGLVALTRSLALEWAPTVRVNAVCPGYVLTPMQEAEYTPEMLEQVNRRIPLGRHATPEELAGLFAYLASDEAAYFTGSVHRHGRRRDRRQRGQRTRRSGRIARRRQP